MKTGIFFFSRDGSTRKAAALLARKIGAETVELRETRKRHGFLGSVFRAARKKAAPLRDCPENRAAEFDRIILGTPIWAGNGTPGVNGFLERTDLSGKELILFTVQADPSGAGSREVCAYLEGLARKRGLTGPVRSFFLHGAAPGKTASEKEMSARIDGLELPL